MHTVAAFGAIAVSALLAVPTVWLGGERVEAKPALDDMQMIEASLAYKNPKAPAQPQKQRSTPPPPVKQEGVSHDEHKKPDDKKDKPDVRPDVKPSPDSDPLAKYRRQDSDLDDGPSQHIGAFDGSQFGVGDVTKGDPYFAALVKDLAWTPPKLAKADAEPPVGCIHLSADGKIPETTFKVKGDDDIAVLAETALKALKHARDDHPIEVPTHLLKQLTTRWICFKFTASE
jgi:hypothetical protein